MNNMKNILLSTTKQLSSLAITKGIDTWGQLVEYVRLLPYGRNSNRNDFSLVLKEEKGSCSSKHALLKLIANENNIPDVKLILAIYKMNKSNTPGIGLDLESYGLAYIPEAHCYLKLGDSREDYTTSSSTFDHLKNDILLEKEIDPLQVIEYKIDFHKKFITKWVNQESTSLSFEHVWLIREKCIKNLTKNQ
jgi:hypothetical protein